MRLVVGERVGVAVGDEHSVLRMLELWEGGKGGGLRAGKRGGVGDKGEG